MALKSQTAYKYSLGPLKRVSATPREKFLQFDVRRGELTPDEPVSYLTQDRLFEPVQAQGFLALSYAPVFRNVVVVPDDAQLVDNEGHEFHLPGRPPAAWPAFGHVGGCGEFLLTGTDASVDVTSSEPFDATSGLKGGWTDPFHQDDVLPASQSNLVDIVTKGRVRGALDDHDVRKINIKVAPPGYVFQWDSAGLRYAISVAHREEIAGTAVRLWGYVWEEDDSQLRSLKAPILGTKLGRTTPFRQAWGPTSHEAWLPFLSPRGGPKAESFATQTLDVLEKGIMKVADELLATGDALGRHAGLTPSWLQYR